MILSLPVVFSFYPYLDKFKGVVEIDGVGAPEGTEIEVYLGGKYNFSEILDEEGSYVIWVNVGNSDDKIEFIINGQVAGSSTRTGTSKELDLIIYTDRDNDGEDDSVDNLIGGGSNINHNYGDLTLFVNETDTIPGNLEGMQKVEIKNEGITVVEFNFDFDNDTLDLFDIEIKKDTGDVGSWIIKGLELPEGETKTIYMNRTNLTLNSVCVKDIELSSISEISTNCDGGNETKVTCDGLNTDGYTCTLTDLTYKITGLEHSGIKQISYTKPTPADETDNGNAGGNDNSGGGGGGGGGAPPVITSITQKTEGSIEDVDEVEEEQTEPETENTEGVNTEEEEGGSGLEGITGAVTGAGFFGSLPGWITIGIAVVVFGILGYQFRGSLKKGVKKLNLRRQKGSEEKEENGGSNQKV